MKALIYEGPRIMNIREVPVPVPGNNEVLIQVKRVGICGSELSGYLGHNSLRKPPLIMGHEFAGIVVQTGEGVTKLQAGDRVTANPLETCGECTACLEGEAQLCPNRKLIGAHLPGAFAEYVVVSEKNTYSIPDSISYDEAAFTEPLACAVHISRLTKLTPADRLLIVGAGPIGLFALQAALCLGLENIVVMDINRERLDIVGKLGGIAVSNEEELLAVKPDSGFDVSVDAVGMQITRAQCVNSVRMGGRVAFTGLHEADSSLPINAIIRNELKLFGAFAYSPVDFETALSWIVAGQIKLLPWTISEPLEKGEACFEKLVSGPGAIAKILLEI